MWAPYESSDQTITLFVTDSVRIKVGGPITKVACVGEGQSVGQMSFTWSAATNESKGQSSPYSGKRQKTSQYDDSIDTAASPGIYTEVKPSISHYSDVKTLAIQDMSHNFPGNTSISNWDIDGGLAADFDGSLSGLGAELGSTTYNMSEALMALPVFKQENLDNGYQYILGAATSPAVKVNEETLTYLNQGQSYEIKLKKLGDLTDYEGYLRSTVRVMFHDRRLQYMEKEQLDTWMNMRPGERILDIDIPLSYGLLSVHVNPNSLNAIDFIWDPTKETGIYVKVNCISTEFTAKKHGGEKGVPFRLQVETKETEEDDAKLVHCASCQVKVFKPKGADRKHKTDREKMEKRTGSDKDKYQPSYECTVLTEIPIDQVVQSVCERNGMTASGSFGSLAQAFKDQSTPSQKYKPPSSSSSNGGLDQWRWQGQGSSPPGSCSRPNLENQAKHRLTPSPVERQKSEPPSPFHSEYGSAIDVPECMHVDATAKEVTAWLQANRFSNYINVFQNFAGSDILRLTRDDLIQICGLADGIRLNNALQSRSVRPRLTVYMCQEPDTVYNAVYLEQLSYAELMQKISDLINIQTQYISEIVIQGPSNIHIILTDEVVRNFPDHSRFWLEVKQEDDNANTVKVLLKTIE
ncbi:transcription factor CP2-like isoform X2 [Mya arenaria]|uniref:transcription factor CP2-like isoform X2 n=1 Tax=Mya arenaria TaxID=6604 RepID=UPI0022E5B229|nr:transcription factor CP2-like isoform X2 [Mya arenaria]